MLARAFAGSRGGWAAGVPLVLLALGCRASAPASTASTATTASSAKTDGWHGLWRAQLRGRSGHGEDDLDLHQILSLERGDLERDPVSYRLLGRLSADVDGHPPSGSSFAELADTYDASVQGWLIEARARYRDKGPLQSIDVGRQRSYTTPEYAWFDGLTLASKPRGAGETVLGAYGGVPVHAYESTTGGDRLLGAWLESRPWRASRLRLDWMDFEEDERFGGEEARLLGASLRQELGPWSASLAHTRVDGLARDARVEGSYYDQEHALVLRASYYRLLEPQGELVLELDPFSKPLHTLLPYHEARLSASKDFGASLHMELGWQIRRLDELADIGPYNRDYDHAYWSATLPELLPEAIVLTTSLDWWDAERNDARGISAELSRALGEGLDAALGSDYSLYRYDWLDAVEREHVRSYYLRLAYRPGGALTHELRYQHDVDDLDSYDGLRWTSTWSF